MAPAVDGQGTTRAGAIAGILCGAAVITPEPEPSAAHHPDPPARTAPTTTRAGSCGSSWSRDRPAAPPRGCAPVCDKGIERGCHVVTQTCRAALLQGLVERAELLGKQVPVDLESTLLIAQHTGPVLVEILKQAASVGTGQPPVPLHVGDLQVTLLHERVEGIADVE